MDYFACSGSTCIKNSMTLNETISSIFRTLISIQTILNYLERNKTKVVLILLVTILTALQCFSGAEIPIGDLHSIKLQSKMAGFVKKQKTARNLFSD